MRTTPEAANDSRMSNQPKQAKITNKIDSVDDLKTINFRHSVPKHSLLLLHWFANTVKIEDDGIWLTFDPKRQYGSHGYGNQDGLLPVGRQYYAVGDLSRDKHEFPSYMYYELRENVGRNLDRIIFSVNEHGVENGAGSMIEEVYLTQHMANEYQEAAYDRGNTYLVTPNLLKQMQRFSEQKQSLWILNSEFRSNATDFQLLDFYEQWSFPHLELLLFTVTKKTQFFQKRKRYRVAAHAATFPALYTGLGFAVGIPENTENQVNSECRGIPAGGLWDQSLQREPEVMTETEVKGKKVPRPNECQPTTHTATPSSQTTMYCVAVGIPTNQHDQKETEASEISVRGLQDHSNEVMTGAHEKGSRAWSNVLTRIKCQPATQAETSSSQTTVHSSKSRYKQKGSGGPVHFEGGLQVHSNETNIQKVMTGGEEKNKMAQSNVSTRNKRVDTSSAQTTGPVCSICIPENRDNQVMSEGSEIATGGVHDQIKETKPEVMTEDEEKGRIAGKNVAAENKCQPETLVATSWSQSTCSERSTGGLQDQSNETRPEVMIGAHEKGSRTGADEKSDRAWSNVLTRFKCQPATHAETSSSQTTAHCSKSKQKGNGGPVHFAGGLQVHSNETKGQKEVMTGGEEKNKMAQTNVSTRNKRVDTSSAQTIAPVFSVCISENRDNRVMSEGSDIATGGLHDQSKETKPEVMTEAEEKGRIAGKNVATENKCQPETLVAPSWSQVAGSERSLGGLQDQSNETRPEVMTGTHEKGSRAWSNVLTRFKCQPATHAETSSSQTTAPVCSICIPENRDNQVMSEGSEIATGDIHDQIKETKPEVMTEAEEKGLIAGKNVAAENQCQPETLVATSWSQSTCSERSTGGLQDQSNETRPEVMIGAHEKGSRTGADEKSGRAWSNVLTRFKCQPATHAETSSSQTTAHCSKSKQKGNGGPVRSPRGLQVQSNETNGQKEVMTGGEEKNEMAQSNVSTRNNRVDTSSAQTTGPVFSICIPENRDNQVMSEGSEITTGGLHDQRHKQKGNGGPVRSAGGLHDQSKETKPVVMTEAEEKGRIAGKNVPAENKCQPETLVITSWSQITGSERSTGGLQDQSNGTRPEVMTEAHEKGSRASSNVLTRFKCQPATHAETSSSQTTRHSSKGRYNQKGSGGPVHFEGGLQVHSNETNGQKEVMTGGEEKNKMAQTNVSTRNKRLDTSSAQTTGPVCSICIPENRDNQVMGEGSENAKGGVHDQIKETKAEVMTEAEEKGRIAGKNVPAEIECQPETLVATSWSQVAGSERSTGGLQDQSNETRPEVMTGTHEKGSRAWSNVLTRFKCQPATHAETSSSQTTAPVFSICIPENRDNQVMSEGSEWSIGGLQDQSNEKRPEVTTGEHEKHRIVWSNMPTHHKYQPETHIATSSSQITALGCGVCIPEYEVMTEISTGGLQGQSDKLKPEGMTGADEMHQVIWINESQPAAHIAPSSSQNAALAAGNPQHTQNPMDGEGSGIISEDLEVLQNQSGDIKLEVVTGTDGKARIVWSNTPSHPKKQDRMVVLFKSNEDKDASKSYEFIGCRESGSYDTTVPLNEGLQARILNAKKWFFFWTGVGQEICRSVEFKNPEPVNISGYDANLQLFVRDGKACVRLYVKKSFKAWKSEFKESWVGFYIFADTKNKEYRYWQWQWQWATKFKPCHDWEDSTYDVHEYDSGRAIAQGVQARFMLRDEVVKASTPSWK